MQIQVDEGMFTLHSPQCTAYRSVVIRLHLFILNGASLELQIK